MSTKEEQQEDCEGFYEGLAHIRGAASSRYDEAVRADAGNVGPIKGGSQPAEGGQAQAALHRAVD